MSDQQSQEMLGYFTMAEDVALPPLQYDPPPGCEVVGFWCWRGDGHLCDESCKSDSVPLYAQTGWAIGVRRNLAARFE